MNELKARSSAGYSPVASMTAVWLANLRHVTNQVNGQQFDSTPRYVVPDLSDGLRWNEFR